MITREDALILLKKYIKNKNLIKHMLACEAAMYKLAEYLKENNPEEWALAGLLHDLDYDKTIKNFSQHGRLTAKILREREDIPANIIQAIESHPGHNDLPRQNKMDYALYALDPLTGLIVAATLMHPEKKLEYVDTKFIMRRFKEKRFAAGADRDQIRTCIDLKIELEEFIDLVLGAMQGISDVLGL